MDNPFYVGWSIHCPKDKPDDLFPFRQDDPTFGIVFRDKNRARGVRRKHFTREFKTIGITQERMRVENLSFSNG